MVLMAIDGSTKSSGVAIFKDKELIHYECVTASSTEKIKRINKMVDRFKELFTEYKVDKVIMEEPLPEDVKNNRKVFKALMYLQAATAIRLLTDLGYKMEDEDFIPVNTWRSKLGITIGRYGQRTTVKQEDINFVKKHYNLDVNDDIADSICIGHAYLLGGVKNTSQAKSAKLNPIGSEESAF